LEPSNILFLQPKKIGPKNGVLDRYKEKTIFEFFSSISWGLENGIKGEK